MLWSCNWRNPVAPSYKMKPIFPSWLSNHQAIQVCISSAIISCFPKYSLHFSYMVPLAVSAVGLKNPFLRISNHHHYKECLSSSSLVHQNPTHSLTSGWTVPFPWPLCEMVQWIHIKLTSSRLGRQSCLQCSGPLCDFFYLLVSMLRIDNAYYSI